MYNNLADTAFVKYKNDESGSIANRRGFYNLTDLLADYTIMGTLDSLFLNYLLLFKCFEKLAKFLLFLLRIFHIRIIIILGAYSNKIMK